MKKRDPIAMLILLVLLGMASLFATVLLWLWWPRIEGWQEINTGIQAIRAHDLTSPVVSERRFSANTFTHQCPSLSIKEYYQQAAEELATKSDQVKTYQYFDKWGWPGVATVLQTPGGYLAVIAFCGNDSDSVSIELMPGTFSPPEAKELPSWHLPPGILRCDWGP